MLAHAARARPTSPASTRPTSPPNGNGTASASSPSSEAGGRRLYTRTGDDISGAFPDLLEAADFDAALDGELLVRSEDGGVATFNELQQRLNRKTVSPEQMRRYPAICAPTTSCRTAREDLRPLPFTERRTAPRALVARLDPDRIDLSPLLTSPPGTTSTPPRRPARPEIEGVMLKRCDAPTSPAARRACGTSGSATRTSSTPC